MRRPGVLPFLWYNLAMRARRFHGILPVLALAAAGCLSGCASNSVVPAQLEPQVDRKVSFAQLKDSPDSHHGRLVVLGGEVLSAKRLKEGTQIEVLQLPLGSSDAPERDRTASEGRFIALHPGFLDPATVPAGTRVTVVGEVTGVKTMPLDETEYTYPVLEVKHIKVWPKYEMARPYYPYPYWGPYGYYRPWGYPWGPYPYWYW